MEPAEYAKQLLDFLSEKRESLSPLLILTHDFPDPDAIASAVALRHLVESEFGIRARVAYGGIIRRTENRTMIRHLKLPVHLLRPGDIKRHARVALVDTQPAFRNNSFPARMKAAIVIDQHGSDREPNADLAIVDPSCGATCVIVAKALLAVGKPIPADVATALAYGIITDTQSFLRTSRRDVVQAYLDIIPSADLGILAEIQNPKKPRRFFTTLMNGIGGATKAGWLLFSHLGAVDYPDVVAEIADTLLGLKGIRWAMCTGRYKGRLRISLRASVGRPAAADVLRDIVAHPADAGGHDTIAGGHISVGVRAGEESWEKAQQELSQRLIKRLRVPRAKTWRYPFRQGG